MRNKGLLLVVSGPSGAGKGTICKELLSRRDDIVVSVSATTRKPRNGEVDGVNYFFLEKEVFEKRIENHEFLEYANVYENYYGTPKDFVMGNIEKGKNVLLEIDIQGALQIKKEYPDGVFVFILPPSMEELRQRIIGRGSETETSLQMRFSAAFSEIEFIEKYDYYIINDEVDKATDALESIIHAEKHKVIRDVREIIKEFKEEGGC